MSIQNIFNQECVYNLPLVKKIIMECKDTHNRNQMIDHALRKCINSYISIDDMNSMQKEKFQLDMIDAFDYFDWTK